MLNLNITPQKLFGWFRRPQLWVTGDWKIITTIYPLMHYILCRVVWQNIKSPRGLSGPYSPDLAPCDFWFFPKVKTPLKEKRFQTIGEIREGTIGQMVIGRTVWGPKIPTLKGTQALLYYVQCFLYLVSSPINVSVFHIIYLDTSWTTNYLYIYIICYCI